MTSGGSSPDRRAPRLVVGLLGFLLSLLPAFGLVRPAQADVPDGISWTASIAGRAVAGVTPGNPMVLTGDERTPVELTVTNGTSQAFTVRSVRLDGRVLGMTFFSYVVRLDAVVAPGETTVRDFELDLSDLSDQSVGLIPARFALTAPDRSTIASVPVPVRVNGSPFSVYAVFGIAVIVLTLGLLLTVLAAIARRRLPDNRFRRGLAFLPLGVGLGLVATVTLSAASLLLPSASRWLTLVVVLGLGAFVVGYLMPVGHPSSPDPDEDQDEDPDDKGDGSVSGAEPARAGWSPFGGGGSRT